MKKKALYFGSFDPFTLGHLEVVKQALLKYDELVIFITDMYDKNYTYSVEDRHKLLDEAIAELPDCDRISVTYGDFSIVNVAICNNVHVLVRGVRPSTADLQKETCLASIHEHTATIVGYELKTEYIYVTDDFLQSTSSLNVKKLWRHSEFILVASMVPHNVYNFLMQRELNFIIENLFIHSDDQRVAKRMLNDAYSERGYHNLQHIGDMLSMLRRYLCITTGTFDAKNHRDIMFAILWHDIIMEADEKESAETKSAKSLLRIASDWNENIHASIDIDEVVGMIKATGIGVEAKTEKQKLIADLDKAVLGTSFMPWWIRYTEGIRMEYFEISDKEYLEGRIKFLQKMYDMDRIYQTEWFYKRFEEQAKQNLKIAICRLKAQLNALNK